MTELLLQRLGCPNCGASYDLNSRDCLYCNSALIIVSIAGTFERSLDARRISESVAKWRQRIKDDPENAEAHYALGLVYLNSKLRDAALHHLRKASLLAPEVADVHYNLALTLFNDGSYSHTSPENSEVIKEIDYTLRLAPSFKEAIAFKHFFLGRKLEEVDNALAIAEYTISVETCPDIAVFRNNLGGCYSNAQAYHQAETHLRRAIELDPQLTAAFTNLCLLMARTTRYHEGIGYGEKAILTMGPAASSPTHAAAHSNLGYCLWKSNRMTEALTHLKKSVALDPSTDVFLENLQHLEKEMTKQASPSQKSKCFVVTATMGDPNHPLAIELSSFRDMVLCRSAFGIRLISLYNRVGPCIASFISSSITMRCVCFICVVVPAAFVARILTRFYCDYPNRSR